MYAGANCRLTDSALERESDERNTAFPVRAVLPPLSGPAQLFDFFRGYPPAQMQNSGMYSGLVEQHPLAHAGQHGFSARPARWPHRYMPHRSTKYPGSLHIDVAGEYHAAAFRRQVPMHAGSGSSVRSTS